MGSPAELGSQVPYGDDAVVRFQQDAERVATEQAAARSLNVDQQFALIQEQITTLKANKSYWRGIGDTADWTTSQTDLAFSNDGIDLTIDVERFCYVDLSLNLGLSNGWTAGGAGGTSQVEHRVMLDGIQIANRFTRIVQVESATTGFGYWSGQSRTVFNGTIQPGDHTLTALLNTVIAGSPPGDQTCRGAFMMIRIGDVV